MSDPINPAPPGRGGFTITKKPSGAWAAYYGAHMFALSGTFCHLMFVLPRRSQR